MSFKSLGQLEKHAYFVLFVALILVLFWHGTWGLADALEAFLKKHYNIDKLTFNSLTIIFVVLMIGVFPQILQKL